MTMNDVDYICHLIDSAKYDEWPRFLRLFKTMKADIIKRDTRLSKNERNRRLTNLLP